MTIREINIHSFGKLKNKKISFSDNLNVIYGTNESGKSTISAFIEAMFYSYPPRDSRRKKYIPWDGNHSSGSMKINTGEEDVTLFRKLTDTPSKDEFKTDPPCTLSDFIPLDRDSYRKSVYCMEGDASHFGRTDEITMRIANIMSTGHENLNADCAIKKLENYRKTLKPKKGSGGVLWETENKITQLENELSSARKEKKASDEYRSGLSVLERKLECFAKRREELIKASADRSYNTGFIDKEILMQKEYIASFPEKIPLYPSPFKFPPGLMLVYALFSVCVFFTGFFVKPKLGIIALVPVIIFTVHYFVSKKLYNRKIQRFLSDLGCSSFEDYEKMLSDKRAAEELCNSLLQKKTSLSARAFSESRKTSEEIDFINAEMMSLTDAIIKMKSSFSNISTRTEEEICAELERERAVRTDIIQKVSAIDKAIEALVYAKDNLSKHLTPSVGEKAMEYVNQIAPKEGRSINLSRDLSLLLTDPFPQDISSCSLGLKNEIYLCFRIALSEFLYGTASPLIFDDPFLGSDDYREKALIDLFLSIAQNRQVILFTNRKNSYYHQINCNFIDISSICDV